MTLARPLHATAEPLVSGNSNDHPLPVDVIDSLAQKVSSVAEAYLAERDLPADNQSRPIYVSHAAQIINEYIATNFKEYRQALNQVQQEAVLADVVEYAMGQKIVNMVRKLAKMGASDVFLKGTSKVIVHYSNGKKQVLAPWFDDIKKMGDMLRLLRISLGLNSTPFDVHHPFFDARLPDGIRVNAAHCVNNTYEVSFRIPNRGITSLSHLIDNNTIDVAMANFLHAVVAAKLNIIIAGGTGAGKTALMLCMLESLESNERVVTIEDRVELDLSTVHPHIDVVELEAVGANSDGVGEVSTRDLVRASLRMHPDRIIVGEARDETARELLQAMVTGNEGSMSTLHARSNDTIVDRLIECAQLPGERVRESVRNAVDIFIHIDRFKNAERRITEVKQVSRVREADGIVRLLPIFEGGGKLLPDNSISHPQYRNPPTAEVMSKLISVGWKP